MVTFSLLLQLILAINILILSKQILGAKRGRLDDLQSLVNRIHTHKDFIIQMCSKHSWSILRHPRYLHLTPLRTSFEGPTNQFKNSGCRAWRLLSVHGLARQPFSRISSGQTPRSETSSNFVGRVCWTGCITSMSVVQKEPRRRDVEGSNGREAKLSVCSRNSRTR